MPTQPVAVSQGKVTVAVIGGGAAGIKAVRELAQANAQVIWIEARERFGGRAWTDTSLGAPVDLGAHWLQDVWSNDPSNPFSNPWVGIAQELSIPVEADELTTHLYQDGTEQPSACDEVLDTLLPKLDLAVESAGNHGLDVPAAQAPELPNLGIYKEFVETLAGPLEESIDLPYFSTLDKSRVRAEGDTNFVAQKGFGALMDAYARKVIEQYKNIQTMQPMRAKAIYWGGPVVLIELKDVKTKMSSSVQVDAVVVTVPTGCIAVKGGLHFVPELPPRTQRALAQLPLGHYMKVALQFSGPLADGSQNYTLYQNAPGKTFCKFTVNADGANIAIAFVGGMKAAALAEVSPKDPSRPTAPPMAPSGPVRMPLAR